jgi:hypothetical protein
MITESTRVAGRRRAWSLRARIVVAVVAAGLGPLVAGCGSGGGSAGVANVASSTDSAAAPAQNRALAYAGCMRSNGVLDYPDPNSSGGTDKSRVTAAESAVGSSRFDAALNACKHLLPSSPSGPTPAEVQRAMNAMATFARCMRSHRVTNWPDPSLDAGRPTFDIHSIDYKAPPISTAIHDCQHLMPGSTLPRMCSSLVGTPGNEGCFGGSARVP